MKLKLKMNVQINEIEVENEIMNLYWLHTAIGYDWEFPDEEPDYYFNILKNKIKIFGVLFCQDAYVILRGVKMRMSSWGEPDVTAWGTGVKPGRSQDDKRHLWSFVSCAFCFFCFRCLGFLCFSVSSFASWELLW